jgi:hypothetical protein
MEDEGDYDDDDGAACPHCGGIIYAAAAWDSGEPDYEPGVLCPHCGEFVADEELDYDYE